MHESHTHSEKTNRCKMGRGRWRGQNLYRWSWKRHRQEGKKGESVGGLDSRWLQMKGREKWWITHEMCNVMRSPFNWLSNNLWCGRWGLEVTRFTYKFEWWNMNLNGISTATHNKLLDSPCIQSDDTIILIWKGKAGGWGTLKDMKVLSLI